MGAWVGKVALITGGAGGIGAAVARAIAEAGGRVAIADRDKGAAAATAEGIGASAIPIAMDVTSEEDARKAVDTVLSVFGRLDFLHNNASIMHRHDKIEDVPAESFRTVIGVNLIGMFLMAKAAVPALKASRGGIVNMSSRGGSRGQPHILSYSAAKAGILAFTRGLAEQLASDGVRVNALIPGLVDTDMARGGPNMRVAASSGSYVFTAAEMATAVLFVAQQQGPRGVIYEYSGTPDGPRLYAVGELEKHEVPNTILATPDL